jgi:endonuclease YncB( thermonuclease family)
MMTLSAMFQRALGAIGVALAFLTAPTISASAETIAGTASVIDGDTIEIHGTRIRLHAIDAIESRQRCFLPGGKAWNCGRDAATALANKIDRAPIACVVRDVDRYGRLVAVCQKGSEDLNAWLVASGWAVAYRRYGRDYIRQEDAARKAHRGIWASDFMMPWDWRRR